MTIKEFLKNKKTFNDLMDFCKQALLFNMQDRAYTYVKKFERFLENDIDFKNQYPDRHKKCYDYLIKFKFLTLHRIQLEKLPKFFENHWIEQYDMPSYYENLFFDLFDANIMSVMIYHKRDEWKQKIINALKNNKQVLFTSKSTNDKITVQRILNDFLPVSLNKKVDAKFINDYLLSLQKKYNIDEITISKLKHLLRFYKILSTSSLDLEGIEEPILFYDDSISNIKVLKRGNEEAISAPHINKIVEDVFSFFANNEPLSQDMRANIEQKNHLLNNYKFTSLNQDKTKNKIIDLEKIYNQPRKFFAEFHQAINSRDKEGIVAGLMLLAKKGHLDEIFERDKKITEVFKNHLASKFSSELANDLQERPREPVYLSYFLQHLLKDILRLDENESAVLAIKLVNELKRAGDKQYLNIAYGDLQSGTFKWKQIIEKNNKLELV